MRHFKIINFVKIGFYYKICQYFITVTVILSIHSYSSKTISFLKQTYYTATTFAAWIIASSNGGCHLALASDLFDLF